MIFLPPFITAVAQEQLVMLEKPQLLLYFSPNCPHCRTVKEYLRSIKKKVALCNVDQNPKCREELFKKGGMSVVPCLMVNDQAYYGDQTIITWLSSHKDLLENEKSTASLDSSEDDLNKR